MVATDWSQFGGGLQQASSPITVDVGPAYPTVSLTVPQAYTFARGTVALSASVGGGQAPTVLTYAVDGLPLASSSWDTTKVADGPHTVTASVVDARGKGAVDSVPVTVDNTPPSTSILSVGSALLSGTLAASAHGSDAYGMHSVQFQIDGQPAGTLMTAPDGGNGYTYQPDAAARRSRPRHAHAHRRRGRRRREHRRVGASLVHDHHVAHSGDTNDAARLDVRVQDGAGAHLDHRRSGPVLGAAVSRRESVWRAGHAAAVLDQLGHDQGRRRKPHRLSGRDRLGHAEDGVEPGHRIRRSTTHRRRR